MAKKNMRDAIWSSLEEVFGAPSIESEIDDFIMALQRNGYVIRRIEKIIDLKVKKK